jgi:hypothetical protein
MATPVPYNSQNSSLVRSVSPGLNRDLARVERTTLVRMAQVQGDGMVQREKILEVDHLTREAMTGHAMLQGWARQLAGDDMILADELRFFTDTARLGKGEILADTISKFCQR